MGKRPPILTRWCPYRGQHKAAIILATLTLFLAGTTVIWLSLDRQPPWWDDSVYLTKSLTMFDALVNGGVADYVRKFFSIIPNRPPLITVFPTPFYLLFGRDPGYAFGVNILFIPVLLGSVYLIGRRFWGSRAGLIAAYVVATMPLIYGLARWYLVEFSLTALVAVAVLLLIESEDFQRFRVTLRFGTICAFGLLLKVTFPLFLLFPFLHVFIRFVSSGRSANAAGSRSPWLQYKSLLAVLFPPLVLALPWYVKNFIPTMHLVELAGFSRDADIYGTGYVFSFSAVKKYLLEVAGSGTSYYYALLAILLIAIIVGSGKFSAFIRSCGREPLIFLSLWGLPFLVFLFGRNKNLRYVTPLLPVFGLFLGFTIDFGLRILRKWQMPLLCLIFIFPAVSAVQKSFFIFGDGLNGLNHFLCVNAPWDVARKYERARWLQKDILRKLSRHATFKAGKKETVMIGTDRAYFNSDNFQLAAVSMRLPFKMVTSAHTANLDELLRSLNSASFFIYKEGGEPEASYYNTHQARLIQEVERNGRFMELPFHWVLPDGGKVRVFENSVSWWSIVQRGFIPSGVEPIPMCHVNFGGKLELTGFSVNQTRNFLRVKYQWTCLKPLDHEYWCFTHILDDRGKIIGFLDHPILGGEPPMESWKKGDTAIEELEFPLTSPHTNNRLSLSVGLFERTSGRRLVISSFVLPKAMKASPGDSDTALIVHPSSSMNSVPVSY